MDEAYPAGLAGRHAVVTGAGSGIGAAIARRLAAAGARVTLIGRREAPLRAVAATLAGATPVVGDICDAAQVSAMLAVARGAAGPIDILVNNAGAAETAPFDGLDMAAWRRMMAVNLDALFIVTQAALADVRAAAHGRIITIASTAGVKGYAYCVPYCAAKHGAIGFTRALAAELATTSVTINAVCPGFTDTPLIDAAVARIVGMTGRTPEAARARLAAFNPQHRLIEPAEVADTVYWLCLPSSRSITGQAIMVAGGEAG